jgi:hypothetical protein
VVPGSRTGCTAACGEAGGGAVCAGIAAALLEPRVRPTPALRPAQFWSAESSKTVDGDARPRAPRQVGMAAWVALHAPTAAVGLGIQPECQFRTKTATEYDRKPGIKRWGCTAA